MRELLAGAHQRRVASSLSLAEASISKLGSRHDGDVMLFHPRPD